MYFLLIIISRKNIDNLIMSILKCPSATFLSFKFNGMIIFHIQYKNEETFCSISNSLAEKSTTSMTYCQADNIYERLMDIFAPPIGHLCGITLGLVMLSICRLLFFGKASLHGNLQTRRYRHWL